MIDFVCYRRHGPNEADEPGATQPVMYGRIRDHETTRQLYAERLMTAGIIDAAGAEQLQDNYRDRLDRGEPVPKSLLGNIGNEYTVDWTPYLDASWDDEVDTTLAPERVAELSHKITALPQGFVLHGRVFVGEGT